MSPTALAVFILAALVLWIAVHPGRLDAVAEALQGNGISKKGTTK